MKAFVIVGAMLACVCRAPGGVVITIENDFFGDSDNNYSHGTELEYVRTVSAGDVFRVGYGWNQLMYTPKKIGRKEMPPTTDRPWAGTMGVYRETWAATPNEEIRTRIEVGVMGPSAHADDSQREIHKLLNNRTPQGWDNQKPDEPMLNIYQDRYLEMCNFNLHDKTSIDAKFLYGGTLGTTFVNGRLGLLSRLGYNIPDKSVHGDIAIKRSRWHDRLFAYFFGEAIGMCVLHNATLADSIFRTKPGTERTIEHFVPVLRYGVVLGYDKFSMTYMWEEHGDEFKHEDDGGMSYGMLRLEFTAHF